MIQVDRSAAVMGRTPRFAGFTLIELIIVIAIIAILAAVALPRLLEAQRDARIAKARAIHSTIRSAAALTRSRCEIDLASAPATLPAANCHASPPRANLDGKAIEIVNRYPAATAAGIDDAADLNPTADRLAIGGAGCPDGARCYDVEGGTVPNCRITYIPASTSGVYITAPITTVITTGC